jgi:hypothetical protein
MPIHHPADTNGDGVISPEERAAWLAANPGKDFGSGWVHDGSGNGFKTPFGTIRSPNLTGDPTADKQRADLNAQGAAAGSFADQGQQGYGAMTQESQQARDYLRDLASGKNSVSAEQLRQANQQTMSAQRSMAASASPQNGPMAALAAMQNMNRASMGLAGQQATAGLAERNAAQQALADMILKQRQQDAQVALDSRGNAISGYGGVKPAGSTLDKWAAPATGGLAAFAKFSDKRLKHEIDDGDDDANATLKGLRAFTYKYKDKSLGKDRELGIMAQDLEKAGLKHTIIETPRGKAVHGGALATANTAMLAALEKRVSKMEGGK